MGGLQEKISSGTSSPRAVLNSKQENLLSPIFNGKDLSGWKTDLEACWTVADGILHAHNDPNQTGDILVTEKLYRNFEVQMDFKLGVGRVDSGIFLRDSQEQIQIGESGSLKRDMSIDIRNILAMELPD